MGTTHETRQYVTTFIDGCGTYAVRLGSNYHRNSVIGEIRRWNFSQGIAVALGNSRAESVDAMNSSRKSFTASLES